MLKNGKTQAPRDYDYSSACAFFLGAIVVSLVCQAAAGVVAAALSDAYPNISENGDFNTAFMIAVQIANGAFIYFFSKLCGRKLRPTVFNRSAVSVRATVLYLTLPVLCAALLMVGMYLPTTWYGYFIHDAVGVPWSAGAIELNTPSSVAMIVIASVFLAPLCEETIYRGVLFDGLNREFTAVKAALLSALAFMLMHMNPLQVVFQFSLGVLSAFIIKKTRMLLPSVILHASANALALVMQLTPFADVLTGCVLWLTNNIAAAFFITLALFAVCGALLFAVVRFCFSPSNGSCEENAPIASESSARAAEKSANDGAETSALNVEALRKKDGTFKYWIGVGLCAMMFIINLIVNLT